MESANDARSMVELQAKAVSEVVEVFARMQMQMRLLINGLKEIAVSIERVDNGRNNTVLAVKNISGIIEETAGNAEMVNEAAGDLLHNVEKLNTTAEVLGGNMAELKDEVTVFKI